MSRPAGTPADDPEGIGVAMTKAAADFDPKEYLRANQDVLQSGINPYEHFKRSGRAEDRPYK